MALIKTMTTPIGLVAENAYHRVEFVVIKDKQNMEFRIRSYVAESGVPFFAEKVIETAYDLDGANPIEQAYLCLKALSEFSDAVDC